MKIINSIKARFQKYLNQGKIVGGDSTKYIMQTKELLSNHREQMNAAQLYEELWLMQNGITEEMKQQMFEELENNIGYVV